jgi:tetratricopeptide (TPR) repeat protein
VDAVLCGTLLRAGNQIRLTAQLLEVPSGTILWSKAVQLTLSDAFEVQDQLARAIVESLAIPLSARDQGQLRRQLPASASAYEFYLRGNQLAYDTSMLPVAAEMYRQAVEQDPGYAPAWAKLGRVHRILAKDGVEAGDAHLRKADEAFRRALQIDPDLSVAHNLYTHFEVESLGKAGEAMARLLGRTRSQAAALSCLRAWRLPCASAVCSAPR